MSDAFYNDMAATADEMITEFGREITLIRKVIDTPSTGTQEGTSHNETSSFNAVEITPNKYNSNFTFDQLAQGKARIFVATPYTGTLEPKPNDKLTVGDEEWNVTGTTPKRPSTITVVYFIEATRQ